MDNPEQMEKYGAQDEDKENNMYWAPPYVGTRLFSLRSLLYILGANNATAQRYLLIAPYKVNVL
jgi:hypothetical protein